MFTLEHEGAPRFTRDKMPNIKDQLGALDISFDTVESSRLVQHAHLSPELLEVLIDVISASTLFNNLVSTSKIDILLYQEIIVSILYRLLAISFHEEKSLPPSIEDAYHVGLTLFMMSLFLQHGRKRLLQYDNITMRLKNVLDSAALDQEHGLKFWLLMVEGVWVVEDDDAQWLPPSVESEARNMGLIDWEHARKVLERYPWIHPLHDEPGIQIWEKAMCYRNSSLAKNFI